MSNKSEFKAQIINDANSFSIILYDGVKDEHGAPKRYATISFFKDGMMLVNAEGPEVDEGISRVQLEGLRDIFPALEALVPYISGEANEQLTPKEV